MPEPSFHGYVYLNIDNPFVAWETYRGVLVSASRAGPEDWPPVSPMFANLIWYRDSARITNEFIIETARTVVAPAKVSRLLGMYFFKDLNLSVHDMSHVDGVGGFTTLVTGVYPDVYLIPRCVDNGLNMVFYREVIEDKTSGRYLASLDPPNPIII